MENVRVHDEQLATGDAFGELVLACQQAGGVSGVAYEVIERSDGFLAVADAARYFSTAADSAFGLAWGRVLDIGAGAGRASVALHDRGHDVVAPRHLARGYCGVPRSRRTDHVHRIRVRTGCIRGRSRSILPHVDEYLGLLGGPAQVPPVLEALGAMAAPGAGIVGETADPYKTTRPLPLDYHEQNRRSARLPGQLRLRVRHERTGTPWWDYLLVRRADERSYLRGAQRDGQRPGLDETLGVTPNWMPSG